MSKSITAGVDFGNQTCVLSIPTKYGIDIILNQSSNRKTQTMVGYQDERRFAGEFALQQQMMNINNTITQLKLLVGLRYDSIEREKISKCVPYKLIRLEDNGLAGVQLENNTILRPEQVIAYLLKSLLEIVQIKNLKIQQFVITVPSWWDELQKRTILNAASISKINIASIIDSATAAAVSYVKIHSDRFSNDPEKKTNVVFIEIGDTSMNVSVSSLSKRSIEIKGFAYDKEISGQAFTRQLEDFLLKKVQEKYKIDPRTNKRAILRFQQAAEKVKKALSANPVIMFEVPSLMNDIDVSIPVKRDEYNELIKSCIEKVSLTIEQALKKSNLSKEDIEAIEVLGGGSRIPAVKTKIKEFFGRDPMMSLDLDECFAVGAGFLAAKADGYDIGIDKISGVCAYGVEALFESKGETVRMEIVRNGNEIPECAKFALPVLREKRVSLMSNGVEIGGVDIRTGVDELVDVEVSLSFDSYGLINIVNTKIKENKQEELEENKQERHEDSKEAETESKDDNDEKNKVVNTEAKTDEKIEEKKVDENKEGKVEQSKDVNTEAKASDIKDEEAECIKDDSNTKSVTVSFSYSPCAVISASAIAEYAQIEAKMAARDKLEIEIDNTKNDLESLIFSTLSELNSVSATSDEEVREISSIKEKVNDIFAWFSENEFERLSLDEYRSKKAKMELQVEQLNQHKRYHEAIDRLNELKKTLAADLEIVKGDELRLALKESVELQLEIPEQLKKIGDVIESSRLDVLKVDVASFERIVNEIDSRSKSLKNAPLIDLVQESKEKKAEEEKEPENESKEDKEEKVEIKEEGASIIKEEGASIIKEEGASIIKEEGASIIKEEAKTADLLGTAASVQNEKEVEPAKESLKEGGDEAKAAEIASINKEEEKVSEAQMKSEKEQECEVKATEASSIAKEGGKPSNMQMAGTKEPPTEGDEESKTANETGLQSSEKESRLSQEEAQSSDDEAAPPPAVAPSCAHPGRSRIRIKKSSRINNNELLIKLDPKRALRPLSSNQRCRVKLPPLPSLEGEETELLSEEKMKNAGTISEERCKSPQRKQNVSRLPPLFKKPNKASETGKEQSKQVIKPRMPMQQRSAVPLHRLHAA